MIPFKINGQKLIFPTRWADVTYRDYVKLLYTPDSLLHYVALFSGIPIETLMKAEIKNLDKLAIALSFLTIPPKMELSATPLIGPYVTPKDVTIESLAQFEDLRNLLKQWPKEPDAVKLAELYLKAAAIYCQKLKDGKYDYTKVPAMEDELHNYSCIEVTQSGGFFLFRLANSSPPTPRRFQNIIRLLKKWIQALQDYRRILVSSRHS